MNIIILKIVRNENTIKLLNEVNVNQIYYKEMYFTDSSSHAVKFCHSWREKKSIFWKPSGCTVTLPDEKVGFGQMPIFVTALSGGCTAEPLLAQC